MNASKIFQGFKELAASPMEFFKAGGRVPEGGAGSQKHPTYISKHQLLRTSSWPSPK